MVDEEIEKTFFKSPAGKKNVVAKLLPLVPEHKTYVEPFAGGATLFFRKERSEREVLSDIDPEIAFAFRFVQEIDDAAIATLKKYQWTGSREYFERLREQRPENDLARFHRFIYLNRFSYYGKREGTGGFAPQMAGKTYARFKRWLWAQEGLKGVAIKSQDYEKVVKQYDSPDTFFFFDPPYSNYVQNVGERDFDETRFARVLSSIKGKFLTTYGVKGDDRIFQGFRTRRLLVTTRVPEGASKRAILLVSNYSIEKRLEGADDITGAIEVESDLVEMFEGVRPIAAEMLQAVFALGNLDAREAPTGMGELVQFLRQLRSLVGDPAGPLPDQAPREAPVVATQLVEVLERLVPMLREPGLDQAVHLVEQTIRCLAETFAIRRIASLRTSDVLLRTDDPMMEVPRTPGKRAAVLQCHFIGQRLHHDVRLEMNDSAIGWTLNTQVAGSLKSPVDSVSAARALVRPFTPDGDRLSKPFRSPALVRGEPKPAGGRALLEVGRAVFEPGERGATEQHKGILITVDRAKVEFGLQTEARHEYFMTGGKHLVGVLRFRRTTADGDDAVWTATLSDDLMPWVLSDEAVAEGVMPQPGHSALPMSLEEVVPKELRFWMLDGEEARNLRDALARSDLFSSEVLRLVDGEFRRVVQKTYVMRRPPKELGAPKRLRFAVTEQAYGAAHAGACRKSWHLFLENPAGGTRSWEFDCDPREQPGKAIAGRYSDRFGTGLLAANGPLAPGAQIDGNVLNTTKSLDSTLQIHDSGLGEISKSASGRIVLSLEGGAGSHRLTLCQEEPGSSVWYLTSGASDEREPPHVVSKAEPFSNVEPMSHGVVPSAPEVGWLVNKMGLNLDRLPAISVEPMLDGLHCVVHKRGTDVMLRFVGDDLNRASSFPRIRKAVQDLPKDCVLEAYLVGTTPSGGTIPSSELRCLKSAMAPVDEGGLSLVATDLLYCGSQALVEHPLSERRRSLEGLVKKRSARLKAVRSTIVSESTSLREAATASTRERGSRGAVIKLVDSTYTPGAETSCWMGVEAARRLRVLVESASQERGGEFIYDCAVVDSGRNIPIGKTAATSVSAKSGDVLEIETTALQIQRPTKSCTVTCNEPVVLAKLDGMQADSLTRLIDVAKPDELVSIYKFYASPDARILNAVNENGEEQVTLAIVMEPGIVDLQGDIYTEEETWLACNRFGEFYNNAGLMHQEIVNGKIVILQNWTTPVAFTIDGQHVRKGTWLQWRRYRDRRLWEKVKSGDLTGLSPGGTGVRKPLASEGADSAA